MSIFDTLNILLIEDEQSVIDLVGDLLADPQRLWPHRIKIRSFKTLAGAKSYIGGGAWDCIILDLNLPDSQSISTFQAVQAVATAPVIVLTGAFNFELKSQLLALGAARCLSKIRIGKDIELLPDVVDNVVRERRKNKIIENMQATLLGELRNLVKECPGCNLWRHPKTDKFIPPSQFLQDFGVNLGSTGSMCPDCMQKHYGHLVQDEE